MKRLFLTIALFALCSSAVAQGTETLLRLSTQNYSLSTARSAAMGGAFTSLGADGISMSQNPAGLGMYRRSEISFSPGLNITSSASRNTAPLSSSMAMDANRNIESATKAVIGNFTAVFAGNGFAVGIGYNRLANFNSDSYIRGVSSSSSLADVFVEQLQGIPSNGIGSPDDNVYQAFYKYPPTYWGGIMGYQSGLINADSYGYYLDGVLDAGDRVEPSMFTSRSGSLNEFTFSGAGNVNDILYYGATVGVTTFNYRQFNRYIEIADADYNTGSLDNYTYNQDMRLNGTGINLKLGVTVRPLDWLRIGVAYHTPTYTTMEQESFADMTVYDFNYQDYGFSDTPIQVSRFDSYSPSRLLGGVSATVAGRLILSADYERVWYSGMGFKRDMDLWNFRPDPMSNPVDNYPTYADHLSSDDYLNLNQIVKNNYRAQNNFRFGAEFQPINGLFLRAGYAYSDSPYKATELQEYGKLEQYSAGLGYRTNRFNIDAAWVMGKTKYLPSKFFEYLPYDSQEMIQSLGVVNTDISQTNIILTFGWRF